MSPTVAFAVFHWQIPGQAFLRDYIWDTRAFSALPGVELRARGMLDTVVRLGPSVTVMGEGSGNGANVGTYVEATVSPQWASAFFIGAGWMWMPNDGDGDPRVRIATTRTHDIGGPLVVDMVSPTSVLERGRSESCLAEPWRGTPWHVSCSIDYRRPPLRGGMVFTVPTRLGRAT